MRETPLCYGIMTLRFVKKAHRRTIQILIKLSIGVTAQKVGKRIWFEKIDTAEENGISHEQLNLNTG